jgi:hypothetical protein
VHYLGAELDNQTRRRLQHETRLNLFDYISRRFLWKQT